ncbi:META domain-containing protein [Vreelandella aquamarina]|uniref:META domain-containing protein n=1 Tax=Vreelandella aquamarina TaxID=77097 RepID=UPI0038504A17
MRISLTITATLCLWLSGCQSHAAQHAHTAPDESLTNTYWKLLTVNDNPVVATNNVREAHVVLHIDSTRLAGSTGCNTLSGRYQHTGQQLTFHPIATTKMACPTAQMRSEQAMLSALQHTKRWEISGSRLELTNAHGEPLAVLEAVHLY